MKTETKFTEVLRPILAGFLVAFWKSLYCLACDSFTTKTEHLFSSKFQLSKEVKKGKCIANNQINNFISKQALCTQSYIEIALKTDAFKWRLDITALVSRSARAVACPPWQTVPRSVLGPLPGTPAWKIPLRKAMCMGT